LRPVRLFRGVPGPLVNWKPGEIDFYIVRENTEGEYSTIGGRMFSGTEREVVIQESVFSRSGIDRFREEIGIPAFELEAQLRSQRSWRTFGRPTLDA
jgi:tartrate dehydrogenase/decarboxylase/D-malate dehydrogenase